MENIEKGGGIRWHWHPFTKMLLIDSPVAPYGIYRYWQYRVPRSPSKKTYRIILSSHLNIAFYKSNEPTRLITHQATVNFWLHLKLFNRITQPSTQVTQSLNGYMLPLIPLLTKSSLGQHVSCSSGLSNIDVVCPRSFCSLACTPQSWSLWDLDPVPTSMWSLWRSLSS